MAVGHMAGVVPHPRFLSVYRRCHADLGTQTPARNTGLGGASRALLSEAGANGARARRDARAVCRIDAGNLVVGFGSAVASSRRRPRPAAVVVGRARMDLFAG